MATGAEFVEGWQVAQVLGEGAYGEVRLLVHSRSGACVALKAVSAVGAGGDAAGGGKGAGAREAALHRALRHANVLCCLGERRHGDVHYLFLEYAQGGELFDRIEPDAGMPPAAARRYWLQLAAGLTYLHGRGVAHRDIKPENLLLDSDDNIKISDFGMATLFRHGTRERLLARVCGTVPYAAPEVLRAASSPYRAPPADLWAAALVLVAMLTGELPWERASHEDQRYAAWVEWTPGEAGEIVSAGPWRKLCPAALAVVRRALLPDPVRRATLDQLLQQPWLANTPPHGDVAGTQRVWSSSQPQAAGADLSPADMDALLSRSQPAHTDDLLLATPADAAPTQLGMLQRVVRRMTRVWLRCSPADALRELGRVLDERHYSWRHLQPLLVAIECGNDMRIHAWASPYADGSASTAYALLEFRRSRGCGLAFKRHYVRLRDALQHMAVPPPAFENLHDLDKQMETD